MLLWHAKHTHTHTYRQRMQNSYILRLFYVTTIISSSVVMNDKTSHESVTSHAALSNIYIKSILRPRLIALFREWAVLMGHMVICMQCKII